MGYLRSLNKTRIKFVMLKIGWPPKQKAFRQSFDVYQLRVPVTPRSLKFSYVIFKRPYAYIYYEHKGIMRRPVWWKICMIKARVDAAPVFIWDERKRYPFILSKDLARRELQDKRSVSHEYMTLPFKKFVYSTNLTVAGISNYDRLFIYYQRRWRTKRVKWLESEKCSNKKDAPYMRTNFLIGDFRCWIKEHTLCVLDT